MKGRLLEDEVRAENPVLASAVKTLKLSWSRALRKASPQRRPAALDVSIHFINSIYIFQKRIVQTIKFKRLNFFEAFKRFGWYYSGLGDAVVVLFCTSILFCKCSIYHHFHNKKDFSNRHVIYI